MCLLHQMIPLNTNNWAPIVFLTLGFRCKSIEWRVIASGPKSRCLFQSITWRCHPTVRGPVNQKTHGWMNSDQWNSLIATQFNWEKELVYLPDLVFLARCSGNRRPLRRDKIDRGFLRKWNGRFPIIYLPGIWGVSSHDVEVYLFRRCRGDASDYRQLGGRSIPLAEPPRAIQNLTQNVLNKPSFCSYCNSCVFSTVILNRI